MNKLAADKKMLNTLSSGEFDVEISAGPSSASQKEIALEFFEKTMAIAPQQLPLVLDLWCENLDIEQMPTIRDRFKTLVPPEILAKEEGKPPPPPKQDPMQDMQMKMAQAELAEKQANVQSKMDKSKIDQGKLALEEKELQLEQLKLKYEAIELQEKLKQDQRDHVIDLHKTEISHREKLTGVLADLHKHGEDLKVKTPVISK